MEKTWELLGHLRWVSTASSVKILPQLTALLDTTAGAMLGDTVVCKMTHPASWLLVPLLQ